MLLMWTDNLSVGIKAFDDDHKRMIAIINELHYEVLGGRARGQVPMEEIEIQLHRLENYAIYHCACEEKLLDMTKYPRLEEHKREHARLVAKIADMSARFKGSTSPADAEEIMNFACEWVKEHIFLEDMDYADYLRSKDVSLARWELGSNADSSSFFDSLREGTLGKDIVGRFKPASS